MKRDYVSFYRKISEPYHHRTELVRLVQFSNMFLEYIFYAAYIFLLYYIYRYRREQLASALLIPGISFLLVSAARRIIHRPRPYETWPIQPLILKDSVGNSLPSRHVFSATVIGVMYLRIWMPAGILLIAAAVYLAWIRVIGGVHYPEDTGAGFLIGAAAGILFLFL